MKHLLLALALLIPVGLGAQTVQIDSTEVTCRVVLHVTVNNPVDSVPVRDTLPFYDTIPVYIDVPAYDTTWTFVYDTTRVTVYDTIPVNPECPPDTVSTPPVDTLPPPPDTIPPPPTGDGEPVYDPAVHTLVYEDDLERYTDVTSMGAVALMGTPRLIPYPSPVLTSQPVPTSTFQLIPDRHGTGQAMRMNAPGDYQSGPSMITGDTPKTDASVTNFFQYWARVEFTPPASSAPSVKWFMAWHRGGTRVQWNTHWGWGFTRNHAGYWMVYDHGGTESQGAQPVGPYFIEAVANSGQWHRFTYEYRPNSAAGARDGIARMWVDGTKIIDVSAATIGVTPPGGEKVWCNADDVDHLAVGLGITHVHWGSTQTTESPPWTHDFDDFIWWTG